MFTTNGIATQLQPLLVLTYICFNSVSYKIISRTEFAHDKGLISFFVTLSLYSKTNNR